MIKKKSSGRKPKRLPKTNLKESLDRAFLEFNSRDYLSSDPIGLVHDFRTNLDRELAGFVAATFAFGNVVSMRKRLTELFSILGPNFSSAIFEEDKLERVEHEWQAYRFYTARDGRRMLSTLARFIDRHSSLSKFYNLACDRANPTIGLAQLRQELHKHCEQPLTPGLKYWIPDASKSPSKRLHLYLRWMVRRDEIDFGLWDFISPRNLILPLDTHLHKIGLKLQLTNRRSADLKTALQMTDALRRIDPEDPIRYDFALCRLGMRAFKDRSIL